MSQSWYGEVHVCIFTRELLAREFPSSLWVFRRNALPLCLDAAQPRARHMFIFVYAERKIFLERTHTVAGVSGATALPLLALRLPTFPAAWADLSGPRVAAYIHARAAAPHSPSASHSRTARVRSAVCCKKVAVVTVPYAHTLTWNTRSVHWDQVLPVFVPCRPHAARSMESTSDLMLDARTGRCTPARVQLNSLCSLSQHPGVESEPPGVCVGPSGPAGCRSSDGLDQAPAAPPRSPPLGGLVDLIVRFPPTSRI